MIKRNLKSFSDNFNTYFYRTRAGAEIDLLLTKADNIKMAIEVKYSLTPEPSREFYIACGDLSPEKKIVVYPGEYTFIKNDIIFLSISNIKSLKSYQN